MEPAPKTTIFEYMSALARETGAINLGQGFPDREHAPELLAAAQRALTGHSNQYPPMRGLTELRRAVADYLARERLYVEASSEELAAAAPFRKDLVEQE